jgi:PAS domain S-box-containing protein
MQESEEHDTHYICLSREITDAKKGDEALLKSEERYRGLLNNLDAGVVVHSSDTSIIMSNQKASELLGLKVEQMLGKQAIDPEWRFLNEDGSSMVMDDFPANRIVNTKESIKNVILGVNRPISNDIVWLLVNGYPFFDTNIDLAEIVISFIDITERKLMEIEITEGRKQAESANKAKTDFLANMSHEIRTPLNGIIGFTHLLMKSNLEKSQSEYMATINESATLLLEIVNDILDFSKIESGKLELNIEELDLFKLTHQVIGLFKYQAEQKNIELILHLGEEVPQFILADSVRLKQILVNLLSNAVKFTNTGTITLDIDTMLNNNKNSSIIKFSVKDTGIGIKGSNNAKIFQSFVQEDNSTNRKFGGTGLGLAISNQLLALMNSKLNLISEYGKGSDFFFEIDFQMLELNKNLIPRTDEVNSGEVIIALQIHGHKKVLIVEDNRINMLLAKTLVKRLISDCIIYEAKDGFEAIEQYKKEMPDIILMDIQMPNKNGYEATMEIRQLENASEIPIIAITAGIMADDKEKCLDAGLNDYLSKPIIESDLEKMLVKWLNN